jgi:hypothetical protein
VPTLYDPEEFAIMPHSAEAIERLELKSLRPGFFNELETYLRSNDTMLFDFLVAQAAALAPENPLDREKIFRCLLLTYSVVTHNETVPVEPYSYTFNVPMKNISY